MPVLLQKNPDTNNQVDTGPGLPELGMTAIGLLRHASALPRGCLPARQAKRKRKAGGFSPCSVEKPRHNPWACCKSSVQRAACFCPWGLQVGSHSKVSLFLLQVLCFCSLIYYLAVWARELIRKRGCKHQFSPHPLLKGMLQIFGFASFLSSLKGDGGGSSLWLNWP